jgi:hypothetical protein
MREENAEKSDPVEETEDVEKNCFDRDNKAECQGRCPGNGHWSQFQDNGQSSEEYYNEEEERKDQHIGFAERNFRIAHKKPAQLQI